LETNTWTPKPACIKNQGIIDTIFTVMTPTELKILNQVHQYYKVITWTDVSLA